MTTERKRLPTFENGKYLSTSASQVKTFDSCPRQWYFRSILKLPTPSTPAQQLGSKVHKSIENYLKYNEVNPEYEAYIEAVKPAIPKAELLVEKEINLFTFEGGPRWVGYIDLAVQMETAQPSILDYKTISDFRYCKTPGELVDDVQLNAYARWVYETSPDAESVNLGHLYLLTKSKTPKLNVVQATTNKTTVDKNWFRDQNKVHEMAEVVEALVPKEGPLPDRSNEVRPEVSACDKYGGCPFRSNCGLQDKLISVISRGGKKDMGESLSQKLAKQKNITLDIAGAPVSGANATLTKATAEVKADPVIGVVPPDAPPRDSLPPTLAEAVANEEKKFKKKSNKPEQAPILENETRASFDLTKFKPVATVTSVSDTVTQPRALARKPLALYFDSMPVVGEHKGRYTLLEEWLAPVMQEVAENAGVPDYRMISYTAKAMLATALREKVKAGDVPDVLLISSYTNGADVASEVLLPMATSVVRKLG